jgi:xanthine dehydrogenase accessory factor
VRQAMNNPFAEVAGELSARRGVVVATVVRESGSVPRRTGAKMIVRADRSTRGSIGGGLFELIVIRDAMAAMRAGASVTKSYSFNPKFTSDDAFGAVCGGRAEVFLEVVMPPDRLLIVGGGHCGRALARMASMMDFSIVVADDREEYARAEDFQFANVEKVMHLSAEFEGLPEPDERTYVALVSKGFMTDASALKRVVNSGAAYIGMIGSRKKRETVYEDLKKQGISEEALLRVKNPIGLDIGAETPEEIAVSILAEIVAVRAGRRGDQMQKDEMQPRRHGETETGSDAEELLPQMKTGE